MRRRRRSPPTTGRSTIRLSIDARLQAKLETLAQGERRSGSARNSRPPSSSSTTRAARSAPASAPPTIVDASRDGAIDMSRAPRSPGSALKPFIYALAFEQGLAHPETVLFDRPARYGAYAPREFRSRLSGHGDRAQGAADVAQPAGDRGARRRRPGDASSRGCTAPAPRSRCRRRRRSASPSASAASASR